MRLNILPTLFILVLLAFTSQAQQQHGFFLAPSVLFGYNYITHIYHPIAPIAPANKGFNVAFQYGAIAGYKLKKLGIQLEFKISNFQQNMAQGDLEGDFNVRYTTLGSLFLVQLGEVNQSGYFHTIKFGALFNNPQYGHYMVKNQVTAEVYRSENELSLLQRNAMLCADYGITKGYKLLWVDFSIRAGYNINNIYKPLTEVNGKNVFLGFQLAFGLYANTNK